MTLKTTVTSLGLLAVIATAGFTPMTARADDQTHKNNWRNGALAGVGVALYGLHKHDTTTTVLGAAGAAYSANRYETDRRHQDQRARARRARYHRYHRSNR